jgi:hypothetical protein
MASLGGRIFCGLASAMYDQSQGNIFVVAWPVQFMAGLWGHLLGGLASVTYGQLRGHVAGILAGATCGGVWRMLCTAWQAQPMETLGRQIFGSLVSTTYGSPHGTYSWPPGGRNLRQLSRDSFLEAR